jgi:hypothetical protein
MNFDVNTLKVIRKKNPKVTDPIRYPKVTGKYELQFKQDYVKVLQDMTVMMAKKMGEYV